MTRPRKDRIVKYPPVVRVFKPQGLPARLIEWIELSLDECEAMRLVDILGLRHEEAAEKMGISRPTLTRLVDSAHKKIATAIIKGKALWISEGPIQLENNRFFCQDCNNNWTSDTAENCPDCGSENLISWQQLQFSMHRNRRRNRYGLQTRR